MLRREIYLHSEIQNGWEYWGMSDSNPLHNVPRHRLTTAVVQLRRTRIGMPAQVLHVGEFDAPFEQIGRR